MTLDKTYAVADGAFKRRFELGRFQGYAVLLITGVCGNSIIKRFDNDRTARDYFEQYTTPIVEQTR